MTIDQKHYQLFRIEPLRIVNDYLNAAQRANVREAELSVKREAVKKLSYRDLLIVQSSSELWHQLMGSLDVQMRRWVCKNLYKLSEPKLMKELKFSKAAAHNLFDDTDWPERPRPFQLGVLFNHPWQLVNEKNPDAFSYSESAEYFITGAAKRTNIQELAAQRAQVISIAGFVITDPQELFPQESSPVTGRWVTTYPEMDYFEFHLSREPLLDKNTQKKILNVFPVANDVITTYTPFRPNKRSLWVMMPKAGRMNEYHGILNELIEYRDATVHHRLK
ncbi:hypothetical protein E5161_07415 [Cohnella pontilimi]|uniref:Uncharacterized protein n=1 Tax=Cohnella pontilimi TaxID=2564100 RepID=A0A4U0FD32_9BACL|nr:hypothetical protein [Cohnella pontilimi]TJY42670.1 hypothetical protein E5161_07415 [Cohnella pontilimi]